jgi:hypothetical protein
LEAAWLYPSGSINPKKGECLFGLLGSLGVVTVGLLQLRTITLLKLERLAIPAPPCELFNLVVILAEGPPESLIAADFRQRLTKLSGPGQWCPSDV